MNCPECGSADCRATETRQRPDNSVRRRRECIKCGHRWSTLERTYSRLPHPQKGQPVERLHVNRKRKLTDEQALAIFYADMSKTTVTKLAKAYGVSHQVVSQIRGGKTYTNLIAQAAGLQLCSNCIHWASSGCYCTMGFPDPELEGPTFAADCTLYEARTQETSRD